MLKRLSPTVLVLFTLISISTIASAQQVWIGSANGWQQMRDHPDEWQFVRTNADGFYINFIELLTTKKEDLAPLCADFTNKNAYFESDSRNDGLGGFPDGGQFTASLQASELSALIDAGFNVRYASLNYGIDQKKLADLRSIGMDAGRSRPVFAQQGPWTIGGDINGSLGNAPETRDWINETDGMSTDGPMSLWEADTGSMRAGSISMVKYAHKLGKTAVVMVTPYDLEPRSKWLKMAQECVREHEDAGAVPDIWDVFEYATDTPTLPETDSSGRPADTITGVAYWLIQHINDPQRCASLSIQSKVHDNSSYTFIIDVKNASQWLDLCPDLSASVRQAPGWVVRFTAAGVDESAPMKSADGLSFVGPYRLWPNTIKTVTATISRTTKTSNAAAPTVSIKLRANESVRNSIEQTLILRPGN